MRSIYSVYLDGREVGTVQVVRERLYYCFHCSVKLPKAAIYRLQVSADNNETDLGICVPEADHFVLTKKIPVKYLADGELSFRLIANERKERFVPVSQDQPFACLTELENAKFVNRNGIAGVLMAP